MRGGTWVGAHTLPPSLETKMAHRNKDFSQPNKTYKKQVLFQRTSFKKLNPQDKGFTQHVVSDVNTPSYVQRTETT